MIASHGNELVELIATRERASQLRQASRDWPSWDLTPRQLCDLELLLNGGFSPLRGFMSRSDYESVCARMRLADDTLWPIPIVLDVSEEFAHSIKIGDSIALREPEGMMLAVLHVEELWHPNLREEAEAIYDTADCEHPGVSYLFQRTHPCYAAGRLEGLDLPPHFDFRSLRLTPSEVRAEFVRLGWQRVVAFQTRNPMHRAHFELTLRAVREVEANLLVHPTVGLTNAGDVDHYTRIRCYQRIMSHYPPHTAQLALLPLAMRMAGPREALWHAIIRKNYGCTHFIVGRDHAGPRHNSNRRPYYDPYAAQELIRKYEAELEITMVPFKTMVYVDDLATYVPEDQIPEGSRTRNISGMQLRRRLVEGREIPEWFTFPEVAEELRRTHPSRQNQGFTVFFTGLSGAGKSTIANTLLVKLLEIGGRPVTLLDGDIVRKHLSSEVGFSREYRNINIRRIGFVASEITKNGGIAICAPIAPYDQVRKEVRAMIGEGRFILVYVTTPLEVCEERDRKGLYAKARAGLIKDFTGISDPYEVPLDAEISVDATTVTPEEAAQRIVLHLEREGFVGSVGYGIQRTENCRSFTTSPDEV